MSISDVTPAVEEHKAPENLSPGVLEGNTFGGYAEQYKKGRKGYPEELFTYLKTLCSKKGPVLDLGCGTGIATRQLRQVFSKVKGCDIDQKMIAAAKSEVSPKITYKVACAQKLPFKDKEFQLETVFLAFHWMTKTKEDTQRSLEEISRTLKPGGYFVVIAKTNAQSYHNKGSDIMKKFINKSKSEVIEPRDDVEHFKNILETHKFKDVSVKSFPAIETRTLDEALAQYQSISKWDLIDEKDRPQALEEIRQCLTNVLREQAEKGQSADILSRKITAHAIIGRLPEAKEIATRRNSV